MFIIRESSNEELGIALYTINKEAKVFRDLKSNLYFFIKNDVVVKNLQEFLIDNYPKLFNKYVFDKYDNLVMGVSTGVELNIKSLENEIRNTQHLIDYDDSNDEDSLDYDKDYLKELTQVKEELNKKIEFLQDDLMDILKEKENSIYELKQKVLKKFSANIVAYHRFRNGDIRPLYRIGNFSFHGDEVNDVPKNIDIENLNTISSENLLGSKKISFDKALEILHRYLNV